MRIACEGKMSGALKISLLLIIAVCFSTGCNQYYNSHKIVFKDGLIYKIGQDEPFTGRILDTLDNRIIEYDVVNGIKNGEFCLTSTINDFAVYGSINNNKNVGKWSYFYHSGQLESQGTFRNDAPHGKWTWYYDNGKVKSVGYYINGFEEGRWKVYDLDGSLISIVTYMSGNVVNDVSVYRMVSL